MKIYSISSYLATKILRDGWRIELRRSLYLLNELVNHPPVMLLGWSLELLGSGYE